MSTETLKAPPPEEMKNKMELETNVMKYAQATRNVDLVDWAVKYSAPFRELFENSDIWERYKSSYDKNSEEIYEWIQVNMDKMLEERK